MTFGWRWDPVEERWYQLNPDGTEPPAPLTTPPNGGTTSFTYGNYSPALVSDQTVLPIVYGDQKVVGQLIYFEDGNASGGGNYGIFIIAVCLGPIQGINKAYVNGQDWTGRLNDGSYSAGMWDWEVHTGAYNQTPNVVVGELPGVAYVYVKVYGQSYAGFFPWSNYIPDNPEFSFDVSGLKVLTSTFSDLSTKVYTKNPALIIRDILIDKEHGAGLVASKIDTTSFTDAYTYYSTADATYPEGFKFTINGYFGKQETLQSFLDAFALASNSIIYQADGVYKIHIEKEAGGIVHNFNTDTDVTNVQYSSLPAVDSPTRVICSFNNSAKALAPDTVVVEDPLIALSMVPIREASYVLQCVSNEKQAHGICVKLFNQSAVSGRVTFDTTPIGAVLYVGDLITLTTNDGLAAAQFIIQQLTRDSSGFYSIQAQQWVTGMFSDVPITSDPPPSSNIQNPFIGPPPYPSLFPSVGPTGPMGPGGGATGPTGPSGVTGITGITGPQGSIGNTGPQGVQGPTGLTGVTGAQGVIGVSGAQGATGATGVTGVQGLTGPTGAAGAQGPTGITGVQGTQGISGIQGDQGITWIGVWSGTHTYAAFDGVVYNGSSWLSLLSTNLNHLPDAVGSTYWQGIALQGAQGVIGPTGVTGAQGVVGPTGITGPAGTTGPTGVTGAAGPTGVTGAVGISGPTGTTGVAGVTGAVGPTGTTGAVGVSGPSGAAGGAGPTGVSGAVGTPGIQWQTVWGYPNTYVFGDAVSYLGSSYISIQNGNTSHTPVPGGTSWWGVMAGVGNTGSDGATGLTGPAGPTGVTGVTGAGVTGVTGVAGPTGHTGVTGVTGTTGVTGATGNVSGSLSPTSIACSGSITATGNITAGYSDKRLKENIKTLENALAKVEQLNGVTFNANSLATSFGYTDKKKQVGIIAQEVQKVLPEVVVPAPFDTDHYGNSLSGESYLAIQYEKLVPLLIEAIKELSAKVNKLENK
jgi:hypothetical protein